MEKVETAEALPRKPDRLADIAEFTHIGFDCCRRAAKGRNFFHDLVSSLFVVIRHDDAATGARKAIAGARPIPEPLPVTTPALSLKSIICNSPPFS
jgi:hypothetical protein